MENGRGAEVPPRDRQSAWITQSWNYALFISINTRRLYRYHSRIKGGVPLRSWQWILGPAGLGRHTITNWISTPCLEISALARRNGQIWSL